MSRFLPLDASVLLRQNGVFSEHQVYHNAAGELFARKGQGYLRLLDHAATSAGKIFWHELDLGSLPYSVHRGRLVLTAYLNAAETRRRKAA